MAAVGHSKAGEEQSSCLGDSDQLQSFQNVQVKKATDSCCSDALHVTELSMHDMIRLQA